MISHFKEIYIDGELDLVDTALWYPKITAKSRQPGKLRVATLTAKCLSGP